MRRTPEDRIRHMYDYATTLLGWTTSGEVTREKLGRSEMVQAAVVKYLELIGEEATALRKLGVDLGPSINLVGMSGMRHRLVHAYEGIDWNYVEQAVWEDIPQLVEQLRTYMARHDTAFGKESGSEEHDAEYPEPS